MAEGTQGTGGLVARGFGRGFASRNGLGRLSFRPMKSYRPSTTGKAMNHARRRVEKARGGAGGRWALHVAAVLACGSAVAAYGAANGHEAPLIPTVHPTMLPTSAIPVPLLIRADQASVWR